MFKSEFGISLEEYEKILDNPEECDKKIDRKQLSKFKFF